MCEKCTRTASLLAKSDWSSKIMYTFYVHDVLKTERVWSSLFEITDWSSKIMNVLSFMF